MKDGQFISMHEDVFRKTSPGLVDKIVNVLRQACIFLEKEDNRS